MSSTSGGPLVDFDGDGRSTTGCSTPTATGLADRAIADDGFAGYVDTDGDGRWDVKLTDTDGDGKADVARRPVIRSSCARCSHWCWGADDFGSQALLVV